MEAVQTSEHLAGEANSGGGLGVDQVKGLYEALGVMAHPILDLPAAGTIAAVMAGPEEGKAELIEMLRKRSRRIALALSDPLNYGFEAATWEDADSILRGDWTLKKGQTSNTEHRTSNPDSESGLRGLSIEGEKKLTEGNDANEGNGPCEILALFGGNRAQKTYYAIKRICQLAHWYPNCLLLAGSETETQSIETVQKYVWDFLGPYYGHLSGKREVTRAVGQEGGRFNYTRTGGFTDRRIGLPNGTVMHFPTYNQDPGIYEGWEFGCRREDYERISKVRAAKGLFVPPNVGAAMDEGMGLKWLQMLARRLPFRKASGLWTFTPIRGITPAIKETVGNSAVTLESRPSELLPRRNLPDLPEGHMPYVRKCAMAKTYAIYFFTQFTKWGNYYEEIKARCVGKDSQYVERVAYGFARDSVGRAYKKFGSWNIIKRQHLPARGTNYFFCDPAGARNWFMIWVRVGPPLWGDGKWTYYIYRDWPDAQTYGEWAMATEREVNEEQRKGWDGDPGPAQAGLGYGISKYKQTILEAERVKVPSGGRTSNIEHRTLNIERKTSSTVTVKQLEEILTRKEKEMDPYQVRLIRGAISRGEDITQVQEEIAERYVDPRAAKSEHLAEEGGTCIIDEFAEVQIDSGNKVTGPGMELIPASGVSIDEGIGLVNDLLDWNDEERLVALMNQPHLFVCEDCQQVRWMFENYTGKAGEAGACKDPADLARYAALAKLEDLAGRATGGKSGRGF